MLEVILGLESWRISGLVIRLKVINMAKRFVDAGDERMMIESECITENVSSWRTDVIQKILNELPMDKVMFEAADPSVFNW